MIRVDAVALRYGTGPEILRDLNFTIASGSFTFISGPSGAGKSSLMKLLYMAMRPSRGRIELFGKDVLSLGRDELPFLRRRIGVVFQDFRLIDHLSVFDNAMMPLRIAGARPSAVRRHVRELLDWVGLGHTLDVRPSTLSGGEQQRLAIVRAVVSRPDLLVADEPTGNVDDASAWRLISLFEELNKLGTTIVIATHNVQFMRALGFPVLHLNQGRLIEAASLSSLGRPGAGPRAEP